MVQWMGLETGLDMIPWMHGYNIMAMKCLMSSSGSTVVEHNLNLKSKFKIHAIFGKGH